VSLALPAALWGLLLLPLVVLLRLLARRPRTVVVPSVIPWRRAAGAALSDRRRALLFDAQLLLQILAVAAAVLAIAGPRWETAGAAQREVVIVFDNSASMDASPHTRDSLGRRGKAFSRVVEELEKLGNVSGSAWITAPRPRRLAGPDADFSELKEALTAAEVVPAGGDLVAAVNAARRGSGEGALLMVASDDLQPLAKLDAESAILIRVGGLAGNVGMVAAAIEDGRVFCAVRNAFGREQQVGVVASALDAKGSPAKAFAEKSRKVAAGARAGFTFDLPGEVRGFVELKLKRAAGNDDLLLDNRVLLRAASEPRPVLLLAPGRSLAKTERAFSALGFPPAVQAAGGRLPRGARLILACGLWPAAVPAGGFAVIVDPPEGGIAGTGVRAAAEVAAARAELSGGEYFPHAGDFALEVAGARKLVLSEGARALLAGVDGGGALIALSAKRRACVLAFDPESTRPKWTGHGSFPVFFERLVARLPALAAMRRSYYRTGEKAPAGFSGRLTAPGGRTVRPGDVLEEAGLYRAGGKPAFAVNLLSEDETSCRVTGREKRSVARWMGASSASRTPLAPWLFALALLCLAAEWWLAWRGRGN
jgi:hypothetical protein